MREINAVCIHHSVTDLNNKDIWEVSVEGHDYVTGYYIDGKEYKGNYHFLIYQDGEIKNPIPEDRYTYHCGVYNINLTSIAICFIGDFSTQKPTNKALTSAKKIIKELKNKYPIKNIWGHKELYATRCPGDWWNLRLILEASMSLTYEQVRRGYLAILRREPDNGKNNNYINSPISLEDFLCELGDSSEHTNLYNDAIKFRKGIKEKYEEVKEKLYKKL